MQVTIHHGFSGKSVVHITFGENLLYYGLLLSETFITFTLAFLCAVHGEVFVIDPVGHFLGSPVSYLQNIILNDMHMIIRAFNYTAIMFLVTFRSCVILHQPQLFVFIGQSLQFSIWLIVPSFFSLTEFSGSSLVVLISMALK